MTHAPIDPHDVTTAETGGASTTRLAGAPGTLGRYTLRAIVGEGGMGVVWRAHDPTLDREIALKVLKVHDATSMRQRLHREARAMARLRHPNVLTIYESGTEGTRDYIAMELVDGASLDAWLATRPPHRQLVDAVLAAGRGLAAAHRAGLVHRDFKPHNVLRDHDGRVLVTDFGLARGLGEVSTAVPATPAPTGLEITLAPDLDGAALGVDATQSPPPTSAAYTPPTDSVLDRSLTQTGAMIGTPAYMAPEQFRGDPADARSDQFAFCITAWQALAGRRPYDGASIDELWAAASRGAPRLEATLAPAVRAVLTRGLAPEPANRWPDLEALLAALESALRPRRARWVTPAVGAAVICLVATSAVVIGRRTAPPDGVVRVAATDAAACVPADAAFGQAWSPATRAELWRTIEARAPAITRATYERTATAFDKLRERWLRSYEDACRVPAAERPHARISCLLGARDEVQVLQQALQQASPELLERFDPFGTLPTITVCDGPTPVSRPAIPDAVRVRVIGALASAQALAGHTHLAEAIARLESEAAEIAWGPLLPQLLATGGNEYLRRGDARSARELLDRASTSAEEALDLRTLALTRLSLAEVALLELARPDATAGPHGSTLHPEIVSALAAARGAVKRAGNDPMQLGALAQIEATALAAHAGWTGQRAALDQARALMRTARQSFVEAGDAIRAARACSMEAWLLVQHGDQRDLEGARQLTQDADAYLRKAGLELAPATDELRAMISRARGEFEQAHRLLDRLHPRATMDAPATITGTVVTATGQPVPGARVVTWHDALEGDPRRLFTDPGAVAGDWTVTGPDGAFTLRAAPGWAIAAETIDAAARTVPRTIGDGPARLALAPTTSARGVLAGDVRGVMVTARYRAGGATLVVGAPVREDGAWELTGLPAGPPPDLVAVGPAGTGERRMRISAPPSAPRWPAGTTLELIARGAGAEPMAVAWLFPRAVAPHTLAEVEALARDAPDVVVSALTPLATRTTTRGRAVYRSGDRHALFTRGPAGTITMCASPATSDVSPVVCAQRVPPYDEVAGPEGVVIEPVVLPVDAPKIAP